MFSNILRNKILRPHFPLLCLEKVWDLSFKMQKKEMGMRKKNGVGNLLKMIKLKYAAHQSLRPQLKKPEHLMGWTGYVTLFLINCLLGFFFPALISSFCILKLNLKPLVKNVNSCYFSTGVKILVRHVCASPRSYKTIFSLL